MDDIKRTSSGLLLAAASSFFFSLTSLLAKFVDLPPIVLSWYGFFGLTLMSAPLLLNKRWNLPPLALKLIVLRSFVGTVFLITSFYAVELIPIGDASVLFYTAPVFTAVLANIFLGEPCTVYGVVVILIIMFGVVLVTQPPILFSDRSVSPDYYKGVFMALSASLTEAVSNVALRELKSVHYSVVMFCHGILSLIFTSALIPFTNWSYTPSPVPFLPLLLSLFSALEQLMMTLALSVEHAGPVALVQASDIIFGYLYQIVFFGEEIKVVSVVGALIITVVVFKMASMKSQTQETKFVSLNHHVC